MYINAGELTELITLQAPPVGKGALGQRAGAWTDAFTCWARPRPVRSRETFAAGTMQGEASIVFLVRYRTDITRDMRVLYRGLAYAILGDPVDVGGAHTALELTCATGIRDSR